MIAGAVLHDRSVRQELTRRPSTSTVQAPHWPWSQPFFVPVRSRCSRSASSRVVHGRDLEMRLGAVDREGDRNPCRAPGWSSATAAPLCLFAPCHSPHGSIGGVERFLASHCSAFCAILPRLAGLPFVRRRRLSDCPRRRHPVLEPWRAGRNLLISQVFRLHCA